MNKFIGQYCSGTGDVEKLKIIEDSLSMLYSTSLLPNISMLYNPDRDSLKEGFIWGNGFWLQNSYGFVYGASPFLSAPWARILQNSLDLHWKRIGDGKRIGADNQIQSADKEYLNICAPDGSLGDTVSDDGIIYKQGDGDFNSYDWFYEATAAAIHMQADILLASRNMGQIIYYLSLMKRSAEFIEGARNRENHLFLVGPGCNLLAPSYGAAKNPVTGNTEKCYLTGLSITYCAALKKMIELFALIGDKENEKLYRYRLGITKESLPLLLTHEGYFLKYIEQRGTMHGLYGEDKYGYIEGVCNIDAIAFGVTDDAILQSIYDKIASIPEMRPFDFLVSNYPELDDAPWNLLGEKCYLGPGDWVDGGCWGTVEGRAVLAYLYLRQFNDAFASVRRSMKWAPRLSNGCSLFTVGAKNSHNSWAGERTPGTSDGEVRQTGVMIDNFAIPICLIRGLIGCDFDQQAVILKSKIAVRY